MLNLGMLQVVYQLYTRAGKFRCLKESSNYFELQEIYLILGLLKLLMKFILCLQKYFKYDQSRTIEQSELFKKDTEVLKQEILR